MPKPRKRPAKGQSPPSRSTTRHRQVEAGSVYHITRKTNDDFFWLVPSKRVNSVLLYLLILKARKYKILIHAFIFLSDHFHLVLTDTLGALPAFMDEFLSESAKAIQAVRGTKRRIWGSRRYSSVQLLDRDAALRAIVYDILNSLKAGLTEPKDWPGLTSARYRFGDTITAVRPDIYFSPNRPESVSMTLVALPCKYTALANTTTTSGSGAQSMREEGKNLVTPELRLAAQQADDAACEELIQELVEMGRAEIHRRLASEGKKLAGVARVLETRCTRRATHPVRRLNPRFATTNAVLMALAIEDMRQFEVDHQAAKLRYIAGKRRTLFPPGTYGYRVLLGVRVARRRRRAA